jgi:transcriptional regulator with XRE-family HTH domain
MSEMKKQFGKMVRAARDSKGLSREQLAEIIGISPKTVQSWENGRTFPEDLSLLPTIGTALGISWSDFLLARRNAKPSAVPLTATTTIEINGQTAEKLKADLEKNWMAVPLIKPGSIGKPVRLLTKEDISEYVVFQKSHGSTCGIYIAAKISGSGYEETVPQGSTVMIDVRKKSPGKNARNRLYAIKKGQKVVAREVNMEEGKAIAFSSSKTRLGQFEIGESTDSAVLGKICSVSCFLGS